MSLLSDYRRLRTGFGPAISTAIIYCKPDAYQFKLRVKEKPTLLQVQPNLTLATGIKQTGECLALIRVAPLSPLSWGCFLGTRQALVVSLTPWRRCEARYDRSPRSCLRGLLRLPLAVELYLPSLKPALTSKPLTNLSAVN
jgi:hypothetical protein